IGFVPSKISLKFASIRLTFASQASPPLTAYHNSVRRWGQMRRVGTHYERVPLFGYVLLADKTFLLRSTLWTTSSISVWMSTRPPRRLQFGTAEVGSSWKLQWLHKPLP